MDSIQNPADLLRTSSRRRNPDCWNRAGRLRGNGVPQPQSTRDCGCWLVLQQGHAIRGAHGVRNPERRLGRPLTRRSTVITVSLRCDHALEGSLLRVPRPIREDRFEGQSLRQFLSWAEPLFFFKNQQEIEESVRRRNHLEQSSSADAALAPNPKSGHHPLGCSQRGLTNDAPAHDALDFTRLATVTRLVSAATSITRSAKNGHTRIG